MDAAAVPPLRRFLRPFRARGILLFILFNHLVAIGYTTLCGLVFLVLSVGGMHDSDLLIMVGILLAPYGLYSMFLFIPALAVAVRRLHDTGRAGWSILLGLIPLAGTVILLLWYASEGMRGQNRFGPDPLADRAAQPFA